MSPTQRPPASVYIQQAEASDEASDEASGESHMASEHGGYDASEDDFNYQQFLADEFRDPVDTKPRRKPWWWYTAWLMIVVFSLPILLQIMSLF